MACFLVPAAEAVVVTAAYIAVKKKEQKIKAPELSQGKDFSVKTDRIALSKKLGWLLSLLWGGVLLLAFEHFWHGEIVPFPPFLSAAGSPDETAQMLHETATVGAAMAGFVTAVWGAVCAFADARVKKIKSSLCKKEA